MNFKPKTRNRAKRVGRKRPAVKNRVPTQKALHTSKSTLADVIAELAKKHKKEALS